MSQSILDVQQSLACRHWALRLSLLVILSLHLYYVLPGSFYFRLKPPTLLGFWKHWVFRRKDHTQHREKVFEYLLREDTLTSECFNILLIKNWSFITSTRLSLGYLQSESRFTSVPQYYGRCSLLCNSYFVSSQVWEVFHQDKHAPIYPFLKDTVHHGLYKPAHSPDLMRQARQTPLRIPRTLNATRFKTFLTLNHAKLSGLR